MVRETIDAAAERLASRRARSMPVLAIIYLAQQASYFLGTGLGTGDRPIHNVQVLSWLTLSAVLLLLLTTGGGWSFSRQVRDFANDEGTRAHRDAAFRLGFVASMIAAMIVYVAGMALAVAGREAAHLVMSVGLATALIRFAWLERRAVRND